MASDAPTMPVNGNYNYGIDQSNPYAAAAQHGYGQAPPTSSTSNGNAANSDIPKDEVGWYFVEQYYTTLSKQPEHLYLYYNKRSQFVSGNETDKVQVCVGQRAINDRIKELAFQDCKVRITNVDSQASDLNIVIQVIGEISNKLQPHRKFTQTFVLATQTNGYFVLNDIFRYIIEEEDVIEPQPESDAQAGEEKEAIVPDVTPITTKEEPKTLTSSADPIAIEQDAKEVDEKIEKKLLNPSAEVNGTHKEGEAAATAAAAPVKAAPAAPVMEEPERPSDPEPTPAASPPKQAPAQPAQPKAAPKPAVPFSWASLAASANKVATPKAPVPAAQPKPAETKTSPAPSNTTAPVAATAAPAQQESAAAAQSDSQDEWTAVGGNHARQQSRQVTAPRQEGPQQKGYIKNVSESLQIPELKEALEKFGKVTHVDINRQKNCAFVDFDTPEAYQAAVAANPHTVGTDTFSVEERKVRPNNGQFNSRGNFQGGRGGRGDFRGGRGGPNQRGRGQGASRGGRGGAAAAAQQS